MNGNLVNIKSVSNETDAQLIKGKLKASGIKSFIIKDDCGGTDPVMQMAFGVELKVHRKDAAKALKILDEKSYKQKISKNKIRENKTVYLSLLSLLMNSIGVGLLVAGYAYLKQLISYGFLFLTFGFILWCITKYRKTKFGKTT